MHSREIYRTLSIPAIVLRIDLCVSTSSPVDVTTPAATIIAVRARSMSEAEVMWLRLRCQTSAAAVKVLRCSKE